MLEANNLLLGALVNVVHLQATAFVLEQVKWIILHVRVNPALVDVFLFQKVGHFACGSLRGWLSEVFGKVCLPV